MKKIGIITLSASDNCGSLLQTYALQYYIEKKLKHKVQIINLITENSKFLYSIFPKNFFLHPKKTLFGLRHYISIKRQKNDYQNFRDKYLNLTPKIYCDIRELEELKDTYDVLITGSDQVWNVRMPDFSNAFFLPWNTTAKKVAYAASIGSIHKFEKKIEEQLSKWLAEFHKISVREKTAQKIIQSQTTIKVEHTVDPTLLLTESEWSLLAGDSLIKNDYIFYYSWSYMDEKMNAIVEEFAKNHQLEVYVINSSKWYQFRPDKFHFSLFEMSGPMAFLNLMKHAKYVFVQSLHGIIFASIFQKEYFSLTSEGVVDSRTKCLLDLLQEQDRSVWTYKDVEVVLQNSKVSTKSVLESAREESVRFLKSAIGS